MEIYNFEEQLAESIRTGNQQKAELILGKIFPGEEIAWNGTDSNDKGIDLVCGGKRIDLKYRNKDCGFDDVALETWSDKERGKVGWTLDDEKESDFIVWVYLDTLKYVVLPFKPLREAFKKHRDDWEMYGTKLQPNVRDGGIYHSEIIYVPIKAIQWAIKGLGNAG